jgi:hypothetical protein
MAGITDNRKSRAEAPEKMHAGEEKRMLTQKSTEEKVGDAQD